MHTFNLARSLIGRFGQSGWRPSLLGWGLGLALVTLAWVIVYRFAIGATTTTDLVALGGIALQFSRYVELRGRPSEPSPTGGLVNNTAITAAT